VNSKTSLLIATLIYGGLLLNAAPVHAKDAPVVTLLSSGTGKKHKLRYQPTAGTVQALTMSMRMQMRMDGGEGHQSDTKLPEITIHMLVKVLNVDRRGNIKSSFKIDKVSVARGEPNQKVTADAIKQALVAMNGIHGEAIINSRGLTKAVSLKLPENMNASIKETMENVRKSMKQLSSPLPKQAVGVGARWKVVQKLSDPRLTLHQNTIFTLNSINGSQVTLGLVIEQHAKPGVIKLSNSPRGVIAKLLVFKGKGTGSVTFDLKQLAPLRSEVKTTMHQELDFTMGERSQSIKMDMDLTMGLNTTSRKPYETK
jgi:hypothetical protein